MIKELFVELKRRRTRKKWQKAAKNYPEYIDPESPSMLLGWLSAKDVADILEGKQKSTKE